MLLNIMRTNKARYGTGLFISKIQKTLIFLVLLFTLTSEVSAAFPQPSSCLTSQSVGVVPDAKLTIFGEMHGTEQAPAFLFDFTCELIRTKKGIQILLEYPVEEERRIQRFLNDNGSLYSLVSSPFFKQAHQDGRTSQAMVHLLQSLKALRQSNPSLLVHAVSAATEEETSRNIRRRIQSAPTDSRTVLLIGNVHAALRKRANGFETVGYRLRNLQPLSLVLVSGPGFAWNCNDEDCGVKPIKGLSKRPKDASDRNIVIREVAGGDYSGYIYFPTVSASRPAKGNLP